MDVLNYGIQSLRFAMQTIEMAAAKPIGEIKSMVSLIDRTDFDEFVYPKDAGKTVFQPTPKPYHTITQEIVSFPFAGRPDWGQRITFDIPWPWQGDFLQWVALRLKPLSWMPPEAQQRIGIDWYLLNPDTFWIWAQQLGTTAIARAEFEVDGVIIESFSGDWLDVWNKTAHECSHAVAFDDALYNKHSDPSSYLNFRLNDDGFIYCYLPFAFTKYLNTAFPMLSCSGPHTLRIHITLKKFSEVTRYTTAARPTCDASPAGTTFEIRDYTFPFRKFTEVVNSANSPGFEVADILLGVAHLEDGALRTAYVNTPHELLLEPVVETQCNEPLKYVVSTGAADTIKIALPLTMANGPIKQILFFIRRKAAIDGYNDWTNYSATLKNDPIFDPIRPMLTRAQLMIGTAVWAEGDEAWWRSQFALANPGGIRASGNYIYGYNFASRPYTFSPSGSANASRVDMRLNLTVAPPGGSADGEWTVSVFIVGQNWMRFQNGLANMLFMD